MARQRLPNRREQVTGRVSFEADDGTGYGLDAWVSVGFAPDGTAGEVFVRPTGPTRGLMNAVANDVGILISRLLQHGDGLEAICSGLGGRGSSPVEAWVRGAAEMVADEIGASFDAGTPSGALAQDEGEGRLSPHPEQASGASASKGDGARDEEGRE